MGRHVGVDAVEEQPSFRGSLEPASIRSKVGCRAGPTQRANLALVDVETLSTASVSSNCWLTLSILDQHLVYCCWLPSRAFLWHWRLSPLPNSPKVIRPGPIHQYNLAPGMSRQG